MNSSPRTKILLLGSEGFSGSYFQRYVRNTKLTKKFSFYGLDRHKSKNELFRTNTIDLLDSEKLTKFIVRLKPNYIINFAAAIGNVSSTHLFQMNVVLPYTLLDACTQIRSSIKKILLISSAAEYGEGKTQLLSENDQTNPVNPYGLSKKLQSEVAHYFFHSLNIPVLCARTFNILGPGLSNKTAIGEIAQKITSAHVGAEIHTGNLSPIRDYLDIHDVIDAYWNILMNGKPGEFYNVCSGQPISMRSVVKKMILISGKKLKLFETTRQSGKKNMKSVGNNKKLMRETNWRPRQPLEQSLKSMVQL